MVTLDQFLIDPAVQDRVVAFEVDQEPIDAFDENPDAPEPRAMLERM